MPALPAGGMVTGLPDTELLASEELLGDDPTCMAILLRSSPLPPLTEATEDPSVWEPVANCLSS